MANIKSSNLEYRRIGDKLEWKRALEAYWNGEISQTELVERTDEISLNNLKKRQEQGVNLIPVGDFSLYDHVLDTSATFGIVPDRYEYDGGKVDLNTYFSIARGLDEAIASEM